MRNLEDLCVDDSGWSTVKDWISKATNPVVVLENPTKGAETLTALQVTTRSPMGALAFRTGGLLVDGGWLRFLGGGHGRLSRSLYEWTHCIDWEHPGTPELLIVADDVLGGTFALNGGALPGAPGEVSYLSPDNLEWEPCDMGYSDLLHWALTGDLALYYRDSRWDGWETEIASVSGDQALSIYPFLWCKGGPIQDRSRRPISILEIVNLQLKFRREIVGRTP